MVRYGRSHHSGPGEKEQNLRSLYGGSKKDQERLSQRINELYNLLTEGREGLSQRINELHNLLTEGREGRLDQDMWDFDLNSSYNFMVTVLNPDRFVVGRFVSLRNNGDYILFDLQPPFLYNKEEILEGAHLHLSLGREVTTADYLRFFVVPYNPIFGPSTYDPNLGETVELQTYNSLVLAIATLTTQLSLIEYLKSYASPKLEENERNELPHLIDLVWRFYGGLTNSLLTQSNIPRSKEKIVIVNENGSERPITCERYSFPSENHGDFGPQNLFNRILGLYRQFYGVGEDFQTNFENLETIINSHLTQAYQNKPFVDYPKMRKILPNLLKEVFSNLFPNLNPLIPHLNYLENLSKLFQERIQGVGRELGWVRSRINKEQRKNDSHPRLF